jgi:hypothetical protein
MAEDFLSFLVNETFKLQKDGEQKLSSLELKLHDYGLTFLKGEFIPQTQMLRFNTPMGVVDVPVNWSVFSIENSEHSLLDEKNDRDLFFTVLKNVWTPALEKILIVNADGFCYVVGLKSGDDSYLHDLLNPQQWLKAA